MNRKYLYLANRIALLCLISIVFQYTLPTANAAIPPGSFEVEAAYEAPDATGFTGLAWDGNNLWSCSKTVSSTGKIYKHNMDINLSIQSEYNTPGRYPSGLAWDGQNLWSCELYSNKVYKHNMDVNLSVQNEYNPPREPGGRTDGLAWDGQNLWTCDNDKGRIYKHNMDSTLSIAFEAKNACSNPRGLCFSAEKENLWSTGSSCSLIIRYNMDSSLTLANNYLLPELYGAWSGLAWANNYLWICESYPESSDSIYSGKAIYKLKPIMPAYTPLNEHVSFDHDTSPFTSSQDTTGCPDGSVGKFSFDANLSNISDSILTDLLVEVAELTNNNLLLTDNGFIGQGNWIYVPMNDDYMDGILSPGEDVDVPFTVCLNNSDPFRFFVDVYGEVLDPATIIVRNTNDSGAGSLRQAIDTAMVGGEIVFDARLSGQTIALTSGELLINKDLTITGLGEDNLAISGGCWDDGCWTDPWGNKHCDGEVEDIVCNGSGRVFHILDNSVVTISELTITEGKEAIINDGTLTINNSMISENWGPGGIGNCGTLIINNSTISENDGGTEPNECIGGGISNNGMLTINNSTISNNRIPPFSTMGSDVYCDFTDCGGGGGIANSGMLTISDSTISGNGAWIGGGIFSPNGSVNIYNTIIKDNWGSRSVSGIFVANGSLIMENSFVIDNLSPNEDSDGGGISLNASSCEIVNSVIAGNSWAEEGTAGGLIFENGSDYQLTNCNIVGNHSPNSIGAAIRVRDAYVTLTNCIVSDNIGITGLDEEDCSGNSSITLNYCNTFNNSPDGCVNVTRNNCLGNPPTAGVDSLFLDPATYNFHLTSGSPCIDTGTSEGAANFDIDGDVRPQGSGYEIGVDEYTGEIP